MRPRITLALPLLLCALPAGAQTEEILRQALQGRYVSIDLDMPATEQGLDLRFDKAEPFDSRQHYQRIRDRDVAIPKGERTQITYVKVKGDHIEVHLDGGGFDWIRDATTRTFTPESKSSREKDLEKRIKDETDSRRRRDMQDEVDDLRRSRERHDDRERREIDEYNLEAHRRDQDRAVRAGSRINLRFKKRVPPEALTPEGLMHFLEPWVQPDDERRDRRRR